MDTKTRKGEALSLLALDTMTSVQHLRLDTLTVEQMGYYIKQETDGYFHLFIAGKYYAACGSEADAKRKFPRYSTSVDACLMLPLPEYHEWRLYRHAIACIDLWMPGRVVETIEVGLDDTFPMAMLDAWWKFQSD